MEHGAGESRAEEEQRLSSSASFPAGKEAVDISTQTGRTDTERWTRSQFVAAGEDQTQDEWWHLGLPQQTVTGESPIIYFVVVSGHSYFILVWGGVKEAVRSRRRQQKMSQSQRETSLRKGWGTWRVITELPQSGDPHRHPRNRAELVTGPQRVNRAPRTHPWPWWQGRGKAHHKASKKCKTQTTATMLVMTGALDNV